MNNILNFYYFKIIKMSLPLLQQKYLQIITDYHSFTSLYDFPSTPTHTNLKFKFSLAPIYYPKIKNPLYPYLPSSHYQNKTKKILEQLKIYNDSNKSKYVKELESKMEPNQSDKRRYEH